MAGLPLEYFIDVQVSLTGAAVARRGFGTPLIFAYFDPATHWPDLARKYSGTTILDTLVSEGFPTYHPVYLMAQALTSQDMKPVEIVVGRRKTPSVQVTNLSILTDETTKTIKVTIRYGGQTETYEVDGLGTGLSAMATALAADINGGVFGVANKITATPDTPATGDVQITQGSSPDTGQIFFYDDLDYIEISDVTPDPGLASDLADIRTDPVTGDDSWYWFTMDGPHSEAQNLAVAAAIESLIKVASIQTQDSSIPAGTAGNLFEDLAGLSYGGTIHNWSRYGMDQYPACRVVAYGAPQDVGSYQFSWPSNGLPGWTKDSRITVDEAAQIEEYYGNYYASVRNVQNYYWGGRTPGGKWAVNRQSVHWLEDQIAANVADIFLRNKTIPFRQKVGAKVVYNGIEYDGDMVGEMLTQAVRKAFDELAGRANGTNLESFSRSYPPSEFQTQDDIDNHTFRGFTFEGTLKGSVGKVVIRGELRT